MQLRIPFFQVELRIELFRVALAIALIGVVAASTAVAQAHFLPDTLTLPGIRLDGSPVPAFERTDELHAWVEGRAEDVRNRSIVVVLEEGARTVDRGTLGDFGVAIDVDAVTARLRAVGHDGDALERAQLARAAREGKLDVPLALSIDAAIGKARLAIVKEAQDVAPVSARLDLDHHGVVPERDGKYVDADAVLAAIATVAATRGAEQGEARVVAPVAIVRPRFTSEFVSTLDIHAVLASYETYFSRRGDQARRGQNIDVAASKLDGLVLTPGEMFSFNAHVGERSEENGFQKSWEIYKGEMVEGVGGGTCQVASTLHAIAYFGGLEILERLPHSRPSAYIPMGLDATVVYPEVDMKLRNPFDFPVVVHATVEGARLKMELLGARKEAKVSFTRELLDTFAYKRKVEEDETLSGNHVTVKQHGIRGYKIKRERTLTFLDGHVRKEEDEQKYPATTEIYEVPPGFDATTLPALPVLDQDEGEGSDTSAAAAAAATGVGVGSGTGTGTLTGESGGVSAVGCVGNCVTAADITFVDAPGAHAPTQGQARPPKKLTLRR